MKRRVDYLAFRKAGGGHLTTSGPETGEERNRHRDGPPGNNFI